MATLRVNVAVFRQFMQEHGWNERELAFHMGLAHSYVNRVLSLKRQPGAKFVAGALEMGLAIDQAFILDGTRSSRSAKASGNRPQMPNPMEEKMRQ